MSLLLHAQSSRTVISVTSFFRGTLRRDEYEYISLAKLEERLSRLGDLELTRDQIAALLRDPEFGFAACRIWLRGKGRGKRRPHAWRRPIPPPPIDAEDDEPAGDVIWQWEAQS